MNRETTTMGMRKMIIVIAGAIVIIFGALYVFGSIGDESVLTPTAAITTPATPR